MTDLPQSADRSLVIDPPNAPEVFVSSVMSVMPEPGGLVKITFGTFRRNESDPSKPPSQVVNLRIVMALPAAANMVQFLGGFLQSVASPPPGTTVQ